MRMIKKAKPYLIALAAALLVTAIIGWGALYRVNGPRTGCISIPE